MWWLDCYFITPPNLFVHWLLFWVKEQIVLSKFCLLFVVCWLSCWVSAAVLRLWPLRCCVSVLVGCFFWSSASFSCLQGVVRHGFACVLTCISRPHYLFVRFLAELGYRLVVCFGVSLYAALFCILFVFPWVFCFLHLLDEYNIFHLKKIKISCMATTMKSNFED